MPPSGTRVCGAKSSSPVFTMLVCRVRGEFTYPSSRRSLDWHCQVCLEERLNTCRNEKVCVESLYPCHASLLCKGIIFCRIKITRRLVLSVDWPQSFLNVREINVLVPNSLPSGTRPQHTATVFTSLPWVTQPYLWWRRDTGSTTTLTSPRKLSHLTS